MVPQQIKKKVIFLLSLFLCFWVMMDNVSASTSGKIIGRVTDAKTNEVLPGANILLEGTSLGAASDIEGYYVISNLQPGAYTMIITYIGYKKKNIRINVGANQTVKQDIKLEYVGTVDGAEIVVVAQAEGQMAAINKQLSARGITNVVSEARIQELPDANAAESLGRLPGVSIQRSGGEAAGVRVRGLGGGANTVYVEGMRMPGADLGGNSRAVGLANISSQMIGGIELRKAFLPDRDADVTGGGIEFKLKEAAPNFNVDVFLRQGYNGFARSKQMRDFAVTISNRYFDDRLGVMINGVYDQKDRGTDYLTARYDIQVTPKNSEDIVPVRATSARLRNRAELRNRYGFTVNMDYRLRNGKLTAKGFYNNMDRRVKESINAYQGEDRSIVYQATKYDQTDRNLLAGLAGEYNLFGGRLDWRLYHSESLAERPDAMSASAVLTSAISYETDPTKGPENLIRHASHDASQAKLSSTRFRSLRNEALENAIVSNFELPFRLNNKIAGYIKFGGKYRGTRRDFQQFGSSLEYGIGSLVNGTEIVKAAFPYWEWQTNKSGAINYANFVNDFTPKNFGSEGDIKFYYPVDFDKLELVMKRTQEHYVREMAREANNYRNRETFGAGYIMAGINIGPYITFTPGVRYESNINTTNALEFIETQGAGYTHVQGKFSNVTAKAKNDFWLPMFNLKIQPFNWFDIRVAMTRTLSRPGFNSYSPRYL